MSLRSLTRVLVVGVLVAGCSDDPVGPPPTYELTLTKAGTGIGTVTSSVAGIVCGATCSSLFYENTSVTLTATVTPGTTFVGWSGGGCTGTGACEVTITAATTVTATFDCTAGSAEFKYTGAAQALDLPECVTVVQIEAWGAEGGSGLPDAPGGLGGYAAGDLTVTGGSTLTVVVGAKGADTSGTDAGVPGAFGGGGAGGTSISGNADQPGGAAGGGGSDVRVGGTGLVDRVIVAGGGGGGGGGTGGSPAGGGPGGGLVGGSGTSYSSGVGFEATGGTQTEGGINGSYAYAGTVEGTDGSLGVGGDGDGGGFSGGGGGGGGYYGGGGGSTHFESGGGGGSSYVDGVAAGTTTPGVRAGHGRVVITW
ncbi:MAG: glycine-rich protein [Gemmatimonadota bacterium]|nr:glycine-rich protein [Gemmatimonadota bacterium]